MQSITTMIKCFTNELQKAWQKRSTVPFIHERWQIGNCNKSNMGSTQWKTLAELHGWSMKAHVRQCKNKIMCGVCLRLASGRTQSSEWHSAYFPIRNAFNCWILLLAMEPLPSTLPARACIFYVDIRQTWRNNQFYCNLSAIRCGSDAVNGTKWVDDLAKKLLFMHIVPIAQSIYFLSKCMMRQHTRTQWTISLGNDILYWYAIDGR